MVVEAVITSLLGMNTDSKLAVFVMCLLISKHVYIYSYDVSCWFIINYNFILPFLMLVNHLWCLCLYIVVTSFINIHTNTTVTVYRSSALLDKL